MAFLSGEGDDSYDYLFTRLYAKWLDRTDVRIRINDYYNLNQTEAIYNNPWTESIEVNGTDGN